MEVDAFRCLFSLRYNEHHLLKFVRPDARKLGSARDTTLALAVVASAEGSALAKIGSIMILAAIKMEVMTPTVKCPDGGSTAIEFHMPSICYPPGSSCGGSISNFKATVRHYLEVHDGSMVLRTFAKWIF